MVESDSPTYERQSVSLRRDQVEAIKRFAIEDKHKKFSRVVQDAVDELIERREQAKQQEAKAA